MILYDDQHTLTITGDVDFSDRVFSVDSWVLFGVCLLSKLHLAAHIEVMIVKFI